MKNNFSHKGTKAQRIHFQKDLLCNFVSWCLRGYFHGMVRFSPAILILPFQARVNTRFTPTNDKKRSSDVGANLVFARAIGPGSASSYPLAPPQIRTSAINASGSSSYGFTARRWNVRPWLAVVESYS